MVGTAECAVVEIVLAVRINIRTHKTTVAWHNESVY